MSLLDWGRLMAWFAVELTALITGAAILQVWVRSTQGRRILWQVVFTSVALIGIVEFSGVREKMPRATLSLHHRFAITVTETQPTAQEAIGPEGLTTAVVPTRASSRVAVKWPGWVWIAGTTLLLARSLVARIWLGLRRRSALPADPESLQMIVQLQGSLGLRWVHAQVWAGLRGPVAFGIFRPTIALPPDFSIRFCSIDRQAMLAHEMAHLTAHDPFWFTISDVVVALTWWHPFIWWARRQLHIATEAAADEASALIPGGPCALAECLVRFGRELAAGSAYSLSAGGNGLKSQLATRVARLLHEPAAWRPASAWARCLPQFSAVIVALTSAILPIQTGLSSSVLASLIASTPAHAETTSPATAPFVTTNQIPTKADTQAVDSRLATNDLLVGYQSVSNGNNEFDGSAFVSTNGQQPAINTIDAVPTNGSTTNLPQILARINDGRLARGNAIGDERAESVSETKLPPKVCLLTKTVLLTERDSDGLGLDWLFGAAPTNGSPLETSHDWNALQGENYGSLSHVTLFYHNHVPKEHPRSVTVDILPSGTSVILSQEQFSALIKRIETATHDDVLAAPKVTTFSGRQAHVTAQDLTEIVTGVEATVNNQVNIGYFTDQVPTGFTVDIIPTAEENDAWHLTVSARYLTFQGYDKSGRDPSVSVPGGKPIKYHPPLPHFRVLEADAESTLSLGQTLAIRGPLVTETIKTKGSLFVRAKSKTIRQRFYVFVTPNSVQ